MVERTDEVPEQKKLNRKHAFHLVPSNRVR